ncbi:hypothetical protein EJ05DRAFT_401668 [Pseudovirgaria hyperparasitica]|uniref:Uncharacterized protein n=1 Tax=Pseudovirgaria hyperparasitica TaxID=470096 RepID=A0A6A6W6H8_9PEZI|nr:uncharacterized protein EJ05DRAFT_401668 [Pseudovirgaria hyperparasitica]KAF2757799.1 hypothetical protein EJ05DRAFT_401668 [Pseudovirgaria hyperparasitica]
MPKPDPLCSPDSLLMGLYYYSLIMGRALFAFRFAFTFVVAFRFLLLPRLVAENGNIHPCRGNGIQSRIRLSTGPEHRPPPLALPMTIHLHSPPTDPSNPRVAIAHSETTGIDTPPFRNYRSRIASGREDRCQKRRFRHEANRKTSDQLRKRPRPSRQFCAEYSVPLMAKCKRMTCPRRMSTS